FARHNIYNTMCF
ncbi:Transcription-repair-coupling factor, partial [Haemophilus influenzae]